MDKDQALEEMMGKLGDFGRYQCFQFILHILAAMTAGIHMLSLVTVAAVPEHRCWINGVDTVESVAAWNSSEILAAIPITVDGQIESCYMYNELNKTAKCFKWVYDNKYKSSSRGIDWNFVCDNRWKGAITQTVFMLGVLTGAATLGGMADKFGRKIIFCWSGVLQLIFGVIAAFISEFWMFLLVQYFYALFGSAGSFITGFVLTMEMVGKSKRTVIGIVFQCAFSLGIIVVAVWGALVDNWKILQVIYGLHGLLLIPHIWLMDESPRWLWAQGRAKEAVEIVQKGLKCNRSKEILEKDRIVAKRKTEKLKDVDGPSVTTLDLFKTPNLRMKTINVCFCWFANSLVYYGLILNMSKIKGNPYLIMTFFGLVELPSYAAVSYLLDIWGRRPMISSMMLIGGVACVIAGYLQSASIASTTTIMAGKFFITGSFAIIYNYTAELFPTVVRNSVLGLGSMCARLSGALTPFISLLDSFDPQVPTVIFGVIALISGFFTTFLPETMGQPMPQSLADGEMFGKGETCFLSCYGRNKSKLYSTQDETSDAMISIEHTNEKV
ncbi:organic cation transporter protein isoform X2 [Battus philenor]|uniref:organic cation transporter protein isoform X2 n=1 Tax=Battus philenor TaxID=42288 RepID=UPI0035CF3B86